MKPKERRAEIASLIGRQGRISVDELALMFGVSAETVRRDLGRLAETGAVQKIHGGAKRARLHAEGSFTERMTESAEAKREIAKKLVQVLEPGDTIFIDTGSTTLICAEEIAAVGRLTVITNSIGIARILGAPELRNAVYLIGGSFSADAGETIGPMAVEQIGEFQADHAILSVAAIDGGVGIMDANFDEARVARAMIERSRHVIVVANAAKFDRMAAFRVCPLDEVDILVSDEAPGPELAAALRTAGVELR